MQWTRFGSVILMAVILLSSLAVAQPIPPGRGDPILPLFSSGNVEDVERGVASIREMLQSDPRRAVDRLNEDWMRALLAAKRYEEVEEFATTGTIAAARDTWRIEQLQKHRVSALLQHGKPAEALAAGTGLFNLCGTGFVPECLQILGECLKAAHPQDPGIVGRFKLQQLAGAQISEPERKKALAELGDNVLAGIKIDPKPYADAVRRLQNGSDYDSLYALGNLLLLSGHAHEARAAFQQAYAAAPATEQRYATEGLVKAIKAEDNCLGRMNAWIISLRPAAK